MLNEFMLKPRYRQRVLLVARIFGKNHQIPLSLLRREIRLLKWHRFDAVALVCDAGYIDSGVW